ncbi:MAG: DNA polymerase IV, partial [Desulfovibrionaceae bacterium]|nr:DNA polymerase IV [Desulfovibrionaceae bacterium]
MMRWICHIDMDAFFASIEQLDDPALRGRPVVVGNGGRGVVAAASYEARRFGVHSAMPVSLARRLCPEGVFVRGRRDRYREVSRTVMKVLGDFSPHVEPASIDEAYLDATGLERLFGPVDMLARRIKEAVRAATGGLTCSVGAAPVKFLAKIASDLVYPSPSPRDR